MDRTARRAAPGRITFDGLTHRYPGGTVAVDGLSLEAPAGEVTVLIGPSGCGKSTILRTVNRLVTPTAGRVLIDGADVAAADAVALRRRVGYVIQHVGLFPHQSVRANVGTVPRLLGWPRRRVRERADELLALVGLDPATHGPRYPHQLSGGQRQRVGLARALAADPVVLLMDEPFSAVDPVVRARLREEFLRLRERVATTIILVTHDVDEAVRLGDRIAVLSAGGRLEQCDPPARLLAAPATPFVAGFVGADRSVRRLAVTPVRAALRPTRPGGATDGLPAVGVDASLYDALAAMLAADARHVVVRDGGRELGTVARSALFALPEPE